MMKATKKRYTLSWNGLHNILVRIDEITEDKNLRRQILIITNNSPAVLGFALACLAALLICPYMSPSAFS